MANKEDYPYLDNINTIKIYNFNGNLMSLFDFTSWTNNQTATPYYTCDFSGHSIISTVLSTTGRLNPSSSGTFALPTNKFIRIDVTTTNNGAEVTYDDYDIVMPFPDATFPQFFTSVYQGVQTGFYYKTSSTPTKPVQSSFNSVSDAIQYIYEHYALIDLYVDGENWVKSSPGQVYSWQSVQAIIGKNGASLALTQIGSSHIDEGEPVSGATADCFDGLLRSNRVATLIDAALPEPEVGGTTVTVHYVIEAASSGSYTYCKLVAKRNKIPNSIEDGDKVIDINPTQDKVTVRNLRPLTKYYFVIFVKDSNNIEGISDPESITTGESSVWNLADVALTTNMDNVKTTTDMSLRQLREYWGTNNILLYSRVTSSGNRLYEFDGNNGNGRNMEAMTDGNSYIPIEHCTMLGLECDIKFDTLTATGVQYLEVGVYTAYINGDYISSQFCFQHLAYPDHYNTDTWYHYSITFDEPRTVDYIMLDTCDGLWRFKDFKVTLS